MLRLYFANKNTRATHIGEGDHSEISVDLCLIKGTKSNAILLRDLICAAKQ